MRRLLGLLWAGRFSWGVMTMSVAPLTAEEFGTFCAIAHKLKLGSLDDLAETAALMAASNAAAYRAQYNEQHDAATAAEILAVANLTAR